MEAHIEAAGGVRRLAKQWGISAAYVSDLRNGRREPGPAILKRVGARKVVTRLVEYEDLG